MELLSGLIGAIITSIVYVLISVKDDMHSLFSTGKGRFSGIWTGEGKDVEIEVVTKYEKALTYKLRCDIRQKGNRVSGVIDVTSDFNNRLYFKGIVLDSTIVNCSYSSNKFKYRDKGVIMAEINSKCDVITGYFSGMRIRENGINVAYYVVHRSE